MMMTTPTIAEQLEAAERELRYRRRVYPRWVVDGRMTQQLADRQVALMEAVGQTLRGLEWQPIETAPRDGTRVLVYASSTNEWFVGFWGRDVETGDSAWVIARAPGAATVIVRKATHWMPLLPPPAIPEPPAQGGLGL